MTRRMIETLKIYLIFECLVLDFCEKLSLLQLDSLQKLHLILSLADGLVESELLLLQLVFYC